MSSATVTLSGRCARDAEPINSSIPGARISIPSEYYKKGEELTMWWKVTLWGKDAEFCLRNVRKGDVVTVTGVPYEYKFQGKDGNEVTQNCVDAKVFKKLASSSPRQGQSADNHQASWGNNQKQSSSGWGNNQQQNNVDDDDVPF
tara:strand:- start:3861 stop:4295 length:435 start_codon:yes stop_codon:yes gene_type:complete